MNAPAKEIAAEQRDELASFHAASSCPEKGHAPLSSLNGITPKIQRL
jgi:hypothetical protein